MDIVDINKYFDEAIKLELNVSEVYSLFSQTFSDDGLFWWELSSEELNHASLIESEKLFYKVNAFPDELFSFEIDVLEKTNNSFNSIIEYFNSNPTRENAFKIVLELENSAIEFHFQKSLESEKSGNAINLFKKLNKADKDHAKRIMEYMNKKVK